MWHRYETACGDRAGTRARLLASATWQTRVVDLAQDEAMLWRGVRRSYHALINRLRKDAGFVIVEGSDADVRTLCRWLHMTEAGRLTRPLQTWDLQGQWVRQGVGHCWLAVRGTDEEGYALRGFVYVVTFRAWSYYLSGASCEPHVQHALQWHAITVLKALGVRWYEVGWQGAAKDEKGKNIEFYKAGWPGKDILARDAPRLCCEPLL